MRNRIRTGFYGAFAAVLYAMVGILTGIVLLFSLVTVIVFRQYEQNDLFDITRDNVLLLALSMLAVLAVIFSVCRFTDARNQTSRGQEKPKFPLAMMLVSGVFSLFMVLVIRGNATNDALQLDKIMQEFAAGSYDSLQAGGYLFIYPFQITYVLIGQLIAVLCGPSNYLMYQLLNVVSIMGNLYCLYCITWELFHDRRVCLVMELLSMGCWFYYVFATFIYSDLWSFALQTAALLFTIYYLNDRRLRNLMAAAVFIAAAALLKTNCYVALIAMIMILFLDVLRPTEGKKEPCKDTPAAGTDTGSRDMGGHSVPFRLRQAILAAAVLLLVTIGSQRAVNAAAARAVGLERLPEGTPAITYIAMGMQETEGKYGWYNGRNVGLFREAGYDRQRTKEASVQSIRESVDAFRNSGRYMVKFYAGKFLSQWGDPTCVSMRELEETERHVQEEKPLAQSLIFGVGSRILQWGMNVIHSMIYLGISVYLWVTLHRMLKKGRGSSCEVTGKELLIVVFLFGGMLFHQLWEASGRYTMRYYLTMLPLAAWGIACIYTKLSKRR